MPHARPAAAAARKVGLAGLLAIAWAAGGQVAEARPTGPGPLVYPLEGTRWRLASFVSDGVEHAVEPGIHPWLRLRGGRAAGSTGCAGLRARYRAGVAEPAAAPISPGASPPVDPASAAPAGAAPAGAAPASAEPPAPSPALSAVAPLAFDAVEVGARPCAEEAARVQGAVLQGLGRVAGSVIRPDPASWQATLDLVDTDGRPVLRYRVDDPGSLGGATWLLERVGDAPAALGLGGEPAVLSFDEDDRGKRRRGGGRVSGSTGCDAFSATYARNEDQVALGPLDRTDVGCPDALAAQEAAILGVLAATSLRVSLPPGALELVSDDDGRRLRYRAADGLEDTTWIRNDAAAGPDESIVTLRLGPAEPGSPSRERLGTAAGEGPCRPYDASYRTNGLLVAFADVAADVDAPCDDPAAERRYLRRLRRAVFVALDGRRLRLLDGRGRVVATFVAPGSP